jgi:hypothetical protein
LFSIAAGMLLTVVALKLVALFGAAVNVSFLRDVGQNVDLPAAWGGLPALLSAWLGWPYDKDPYPPPPAPGTGPYATPGDVPYPYGWPDLPPSNYPSTFWERFEVWQYEKLLDAERRPIFTAASSDNSGMVMGKYAGARTLARRFRVTDLYEDVGDK